MVLCGRRIAAGRRVEVRGGRRRGSVPGRRRRLRAGCVAIATKVRGMGEVGELGADRLDGAVGRGGRAVGRAARPFDHRRRPDSFCSLSAAAVTRRSRQRGPSITGADSHGTCVATRRARCDKVGCSRTNVVSVAFDCLRQPRASRPRARSTRTRPRLARFRPPPSPHTYRPRPSHRSVLFAPYRPADRSAQVVN